MGRGESNILYDPPKMIIRGQGEPILSLGEKKVFAAPSREVFLGSEGGIVLQEERGGLYPVLFSAGKRKSRGILRRKAINISRSTPVSLSDEGILYSYEDTIYFKKRDALADDPFIYPMYESGKVLGLHAGKDDFYYLWIDLAGQGDVCFSSIRRDPHSSAKATLTNHTAHREQVVLENKDGQSVLFYYPEEDGSAMLQTVSEEGLGKARKLDLKTEKDLFSLPYETLVYEAGEHHLAPGVEDGQYFYRHPESGAIHFLDLERGENRIIINNEDKGLDNVHALRSAGGFLYLLQAKKLSLISDKGLAREIDLPSDFKKITIGKNKAILWTPGDEAYQEIKIK